MAEHYFSSQSGRDFTPQPLTVDLAGAPRTVVTAPGIFSPKGVDKGTAVLLREAPAPRGPRMLDIGCGWGPLSLTLALLSPDAEVTGVDVNERSLALTSMNAERLGLGNVSARLPDDVDPSLRFDTIWSNPPIRVGKEALHGILLTWLPRLAPGGSAYLVVQKNLGADSLAAWLETALGEGFSVARLATSKGFRILQVLRAG
ncbi:class I SAM-dependent methyltransferase [Rothia sp. AR01]|uniref:Class I SAM-dependent methyltransferase n=1 Tax=Rothia santali TaxID=2949643 RepID=A0A9X2HJ74_9MICC|nr:methyltransferase [Rothia santali]MCP3425248.1 class I SAM-dependent methyltransferase [Rothia santali]